MGWRDLLDKGDETITLPWLGGRALRSADRVWTINGRLPQEHGWYVFKVAARTANEPVPSEAVPETLKFSRAGYLVGDRLVADDSRVDPDPKRISECSEPVHLLEPGLDRFARVTAGRVYKEGPLVFIGLAMPVGCEDDVLRAYLDQEPSVAGIKGVPPALDAAFRMEVWQRAEAERRRLELERLRRVEEERLAKEARRRRLVEQLGDGAGRRAMAVEDFQEAARAALAVGGATLLDVRNGPCRNEKILRYRLDGRRFECICDGITLRIVDAGICLINHATDERGDTYFTLESLPGVVREAQREGKLVVFRHV